MKNQSKKWCGIVVAVVMVMAGSVSMVWAKKANEDLGIIPTQTKVDALKYEDWSVKWWQWSVAVPVPENPLFDGADCANGANGQEGPVWFLTGFFTDTPERFCEVPAGKYLFLPIINTECSTLEEPPFFGANKRELRKCANSFQYSDVFATVDDEEVQGLDSYIIESPLFTFTVPEDNWLGVDVGEVGDTGQSAANGYYLMLKPLEVGEVREICFGGTYPDLAFSVAGCYSLTGVAP
jgi:hypothetical protein